MKKTLEELRPAMLNHLDINRLEKKWWLMGLVYRYIEHCKKQADRNNNERQKEIGFLLDNGSDSCYIDNSAICWGDIR